jgi:hypothetical protein
MKNRQLVFPIGLAAIAVMVVWLANPWTIASAQSASAAGAVQATASGGVQGPTLPYGANEVLKLYKGGVSKDVIINYIDSTVMPYHLTADGIIYLQTVGVPQEITQAMILRDGQLRQQFSQQYYQQQMAAANAAATAQGSAQVATPATPAPDATVVGGSDYPNYYDYGYPGYYGYGWPYYGWPLGFGGGWGWGGYGGFRGGYGGFHGGYGGFRGGVGGFRGGVGGFHGGGAIRGGGFHGGFGGGHMGGGHGGGGGHR